MNSEKLTNKKHSALNSSRSGDVGDSDDEFGDRRTAVRIDEDETAHSDGSVDRRGQCRSERSSETEECIVRRRRRRRRRPVDMQGSNEESSSPMGEYEADFRSNPTQLFLRMNYRLWDLAVQQIELWPFEAQVWIVSRGGIIDNEGVSTATVQWRNLPLHLACLQAPDPAPLMLVNTLIDAHPEGVRRHNHEGNLPVHLACDNRALGRNGVEGEGVILALVEAYPESLNMRDDRGRLPVEILEANGMRADHRKAQAWRGGSIMCYMRTKMAEMKSLPQSAEPEIKVAPRKISPKKHRRKKSRGRRVEQHDINMIGNGHVEHEEDAGGHNHRTRRANGREDSRQNTDELRVNGDESPSNISHVAACSSCDDRPVVIDAILGQSERLLAEEVESHNEHNKRDSLEALVGRVSEQNAMLRNILDRVERGDDNIERRSVKSDASIHCSSEVEEDCILKGQFNDLKMELASMMDIYALIEERFRKKKETEEKQRQRISSLKAKLDEEKSKRAAAKMSLVVEAKAKAALVTLVEDCNKELVTKQAMELKLKSELTKKEEQTTVIVEKHGSTTRTLEEVRRKHAGAKKSVEQLKRSVSDLEAKCHELAELNAAQEEHINTLTASNSSLCIEKTIFEENVARAHSMEKKELCSQLSEKDSIVNEKDALIEKLQSERDILQNTISDLNIKAEMDLEDKRRMERDNADLLHQLSKSKKKAKEMSQRIQSLGEDVASTKKELEDQSQTNAIMTEAVESNARLRVQLERAKKTIAKNVQTLSAMASCNEMYKAKERDLKEDNSSLKDQLSAMTASNSDTAESLQAIVSEKEQIMKRLDEMSDKVENQETEIKQLRNEIEQKEADISLLENRKEAAAASVKDIEDILDVDATKDALRSENNELKEELLKMHEMNQELFKSGAVLGRGPPSLNEMNTYNSSGASRILPEINCANLAKIAEVPMLDDNGDGGYFSHIETGLQSVLRLDQESRSPIFSPNDDDVKSYEKLVALRNETDIKSKLSVLVEQKNRFQGEVNILVNNIMHQKEVIADLLSRLNARLKEVEVLQERNDSLKAEKISLQERLSQYSMQTQQLEERLNELSSKRMLLQPRLAGGASKSEILLRLTELEVKKDELRLKKQAMVERDMLRNKTFSHVDSESRQDTDRHE